MVTFAALAPRVPIRCRPILDQARLTSGACAAPARKANRAAVTHTHQATTFDLRKPGLHHCQSRVRDADHLAATQIVECPIGLRRNGTSRAIKRRPRGSIQVPRPGRIEKTPPRISSSPRGRRTQRECGWRSHRDARPRRSGNSCSSRLNACLRILFPSITTVFLNDSLHQ